MLKKRLIGVITVQNGWAVQSFGYNYHLPLGHTEILAENLDRWGADEILLQCIDRSISSQGPDFKLLERVAKKGLGTPLIYGGGIRSVEDGVRAVSSGADRIVVDALMHDDLKTVEALSHRLGAQAIIAALPLSLENDTLKWLDYRKKLNRPLCSDLIDLIDKNVVSEVLAIDWRNEGKRNGFEFGLVDFFPSSTAAIIVFGGISNSEQLRRLLGTSRVVAVGMGNFLNYRESAVNSFREMGSGLSLREPFQTFSREGGSI